MKKLIPLLITLSVFIAGCKKSDTDSSNSTQNVIHCRLLNSSVLQNGVTFTSLFSYDANGNVLELKDCSKGDTTLSEKFQYKNGVLQFSVYNFSSTSDTTFYYYNAQSKLDYTLDHRYMGQNFTMTRMDFIYDPVGHVICTTSKDASGSGNSSVDSSIYEYTGNNVTKINKYSKYTGYDWITTTTLLTYDSMKNFYKATNLPPTSYKYFSDNNITRVTYADSTSAQETITFTGYNSSGYPVAGVFVYYYFNDTLTQNINFNYKCDF